MSQTLGLLDRSCTTCELSKPIKHFSPAHCFCPKASFNITNVSLAVLPLLKQNLNAHSMFFKIGHFLKKRVSQKAQHSIMSHVMRYYVTVTLSKSAAITLHTLLYLQLTYLLHVAESLQRSQPVLSQSRNSPHFMEPEGSLSHSHMPATCPYPEPSRSSPRPHIPLPLYLKLVNKFCTVVSLCGKPRNFTVNTSYNFKIKNVTAEFIIIIPPSLSLHITLLPTV